jgi:citrate lyase subunit alpha / citrate CoA-transferase
VAVNPLRLDLSERLRHAGLPVKEMEELRATALRLAGDPAPTRTGERVVAVVEYRDGTVIDVVREAAV